MYARSLPRIRATPVDIAIAAAIVLLGIPLVVGGVAAAAFLLFPPNVDIPEPKAETLAETSHIYAADGTLIAKLHSEFNRVPIALDQMPQHLREAAVAAEDSRFFEHRGVDAKAIMRALWADVQAGAAVQGGSTITQQYVKNAYVGKKRSVLRKFREALVASTLERRMSKEKILERYLNTVYLGNGAYGVEAAARTYFGKGASELTVSESALVVGLIPAPVRFDPYNHASDAEIRRVYVLERMQQLGLLSPQNAAKAKAERPELTSQVKEEVLRYPWFVDAVRRYLLKRYGETKVFAGGLAVTTTIDPRLQEVAEKAVREALPDLTDPYASLAAVDPKTGFVRALVGGRDWGEEKYNIAIQGRRQPGSSFKPFVLVAALERGIPPTARYRGPGTICIEGWKPDCHVSNFDRSGFGTITLEKATINSVNTVYAQLVMDVGPDRVVDVTKRMGIPGPGWLPARSGCKATETDPCGTLIETVPALALGTEEVTPLEMASAFATLAARGTYREPKVVSKVTDASGRVLESGPAEPVQAIETRIADAVNEILQQVITKGTAKRADIGRPAAGKTGTAEDFRNAWFAGYTPDLATGVWVGYRDANRPLLNVRGVARVVGGSIPAQIWAAFMKPALEGTPPAEFPEAGAIEDLRLRLPPPPEPSPEESPEPDPSPSPFPQPSVSPTPIPSPPRFPFPVPVPTRGRSAA